MWETGVVVAPSLQFFSIFERVGEVLPPCYHRANLAIPKAPLLDAIWNVFMWMLVLAVH